MFGSPESSHLNKSKLKTGQRGGTITFPWCIRLFLMMIRDPLVVKDSQGLMDLRVPKVRSRSVTQDVPVHESRAIVRYTAGTTGLFPSVDGDIWQSTPRSCSCAS
jgi:hypothetical protein